MRKWCKVDRKGKSGSRGKACFALMRFSAKMDFLAGRDMFRAPVKEISHFLESNTARKTHI